MLEPHLVISSGSHTTAMEAISNGKINICAHTQPEQHGNANKIDWLGIGKAVDKPKKLIEALMEIEDNYDFYKSNVEKLMPVAGSMNGVERTVEIIEN